MDNKALTSTNEGPFGYSFPSQPDASVDNAPAPSGGLSLLSSEERKFMDRFLQAVASLEQEDTKYLEDPFSGQKALGGSNIWTSQFPPTCQDLVSSLPSPSTNATGLDHHVSVPNHSILSSIVYPLMVNPVDVFLPSSTTHPNQSQQPVPSETTSASDQAISADAHQYTHYEHASATYAPMDSNAWSSPHVQGLTVDPSISYAGLSSNHTKQAPRACEALKAFSWGSDPHFAKNRFVAPANQRTEESVTMEVLNQFQCLDSQGSVATTRACSPFADGQNRLSSKNMDSIDLATRAPRTENVTKPSPKRQRLPMTQEEEDLPFERSPLPPKKKWVALPAKKRGRPKAQRSDGQAATQGQHPKKKRAREKLTDEEKRSNHVSSEQKRRNEQNKQWDDLSDFVSGIEDCKRTKCDRITYSNRWLRRLLEDNERMESCLNALTSSSSVSGRDQDLTFADGSDERIGV
ncbi:MAG: hypothetical protein Q9188_000792 [Gyalolechia gomerana]